MTSHNIKDLLHNLSDYMFTSTNVDRYTKHVIHFAKTDLKPKCCLKNIREPTHANNKPARTTHTTHSSHKNIYKPRQADSLFWCFYILKNGFFKYEMEINNQHFTVEKTEKFKYIETMRKNKELLKLHNIKPFTELEDNLANGRTISIKTFFALCAMESINVLLVHKRKVYELLCTDDTLVNVVHKSDHDYWIELDVSEDAIQTYRDTYYLMPNLDSKLKSMSSYKVDELLELCKKLDIKTDDKDAQKTRLTKKDIYEMLVMKY